MAGTGYVKVVESVGFYDDEDGQISLPAGTLLGEGHRYAKRLKASVVPAEESDITLFPSPKRRKPVEQATAAPGEQRNTATADPPKPRRKATK